MRREDGCNLHVDIWADETVDLDESNSVLNEPFTALDFGTQTAYLTAGDARWVAALLQDAAYHLGHLEDLPSGRA